MKTIVVVFIIGLLIGAGTLWIYNGIVRHDNDEMYYWGEANGYNRGYRSGYETGFDAGANYTITKIPDNENWTMVNEDK